MDGSNSFNSVPNFRDFDQLNKGLSIEGLLKEVESLKGKVHDSSYSNRLFFETFNSNKIEGNSLSQFDTKVLLDGIDIPNAPAKDIIETLNLANTIERYLKIKDLSLELILEIHSELTNRTMNKKYCGTLRDCEVHIEGSLHRPPNYNLVGDLLKESINNYNESNRAIIDILKFKYELVTIHPFIDGNGRTSRVIMNGLLEYDNYPRLVITDKNKSIYYKTLQNSQVNYGPSEFIKYGLILMKYTLMYLNEPKILD